MKRACSGVCSAFLCAVLSVPVLASSAQAVDVELTQVPALGEPIPSTGSDEHRIGAQPLPDGVSFGDLADMEAEALSTSSGAIPRMGDASVTVMACLRV
jgi:hypothetical protein